jgi:prevent-host-death family protein
MPSVTDYLDLTVDLNHGVVPISKAASSLAALLKRARERRQPIVITQKGYPTGVLLSIEIYDLLCERLRPAGEAPPEGAEREAGGAGRPPE